MFDYTPFYRSSIGFDRLFRLLDEAQNLEPQSFPPYNIERVSENEYRITMAVAGFGEKDIAIESKGNALTVTGKKNGKDETAGEMLPPGHWPPDRPARVRRTGSRWPQTPHRHPLPAPAPSGPRPLH